MFAVLNVLYAYVLYFCICTCSAQLTRFHMERRSRNTLIIIIIVIIIITFIIIISEQREYIGAASRQQSTKQKIQSKQLINTTSQGSLFDTFTTHPAKIAPG